MQNHCSCFGSHFFFCSSSMYFMFRSWRNRLFVSNLVIHFSWICDFFLQWKARPRQEISDKTLFQCIFFRRLPALKRPNSESQTMDKRIFPTFQVFHQDELFALLAKCIDRIKNLCICNHHQFTFEILFNLAWLLNPKTPSGIPYSLSLLYHYNYVPTTKTTAAPTL